MLRKSNLYVVVGNFIKARFLVAKEQTKLSGESLNKRLDRSKADFDSILSLAAKDNLPVYFISLPDGYEVMAKSYLYPEFYGQIANYSKSKNVGSGKFLNGLRGLVLIPSPRPSPGGRGSIAYLERQTHCQWQWLHLNLNHYQNVIFVDMLDHFSRYSEKIDEIFPTKDLAHPNPKGHKILADHLCQEIIKDQRPSRR